MFSLAVKLWHLFVPPASLSPPAWWSDNGNSGSFDGEIVGHRSGERLANGVYWVRENGTMKVYRRRLNFETGKSTKL